MKQTNKKRSGGKKGIRLHACLCAPRKWSVSIKTQTAAITGKWLDNGEAIALAQLYLSLIFNWLPFISLFPLNWLIQSPLSLFMKPLFSISIALITCETLFIYFLCLPLFLEGRNPVLFPIVYILSEEQGVRHRADKVSTKLGTSINSEWMKLGCCFVFLYFLDEHDYFWNRRQMGSWAKQLMFVKWNDTEILSSARWEQSLIPFPHQNGRNELTVRNLLNRNGKVGFFTANKQGKWKNE